MNEHKHHHGHTDHAGRGHAAHDMHPIAPPEKSHTDPVCGMKVAPNPEKKITHAGVDYFFCSTRCMDKFRFDPQAYIAPATTQPAQTQPEGTVYTCPMHPEIRQPVPGNCPICGMTLEPLMPTLDDSENAELIDFRRRFWWTLPLTVIVAVLAMFGHQLSWFESAVQSWIELVLTIPIVLWAGWPFFVRGAQSVINRSPNMWTLIGLGTGAAFVYSVVATVAPQAFPASFMSMGRIGVYFEVGSPGTELEFAL